MLARLQSSNDIKNSIDRLDEDIQKIKVELSYHKSFSPKLNQKWTKRIFLKRN